MDLNPNQTAVIERLRENESLTDNLTDSDASVLLDWAEKQILANTDGELVTAAVSAANQSGQNGAEALLAQAAAFLSQELAGRAINSKGAPDASFSQADTTVASGEASVETPPKQMDDRAQPSGKSRRAARRARTRESSSSSHKMKATGAVGEQQLPDEQTDAKIDAGTSDASRKTPGKKSRRKSPHSA